MSPSPHPRITTACKLRRAFFAAALLIWISSAAECARAQYTLNFQTNIIDGVVSNWTGDYFVGHTNYNDVLIIQNGGVLSNWVGAMAGVYTSSNNLAVITGAGSFWTNNGYLILSGGDISYAAGPGNRMVITNGGTVYSYHGYIGGYVVGSVGSNSVLVSDSGSAWITSQQFVVGDGSLGNSLVVSNGGAIIANEGYLGYQNADGDALVTGAGSFWTNSADLQVGYYGGGTRLTILKGGTVVNAFGYIGYHGGNNLVWVSDPGSIWTNRNDLYIGNASTGNQLVVTNSGSVCASNIYVGSGGQANLILNGGSLVASTFFATNGSNSGVEFDSGTLISTAGTLVNNGPVFVIGDGLQTATLQMTGAGNTFSNNVWVRANALMQGCAIVYGATLIDGALIADCGGSFVVFGSLTNNGTIELRNGNTLDVYGQLINNGTIIATNGVLRSYSSVTNNGTILGGYFDMHNAWTNAANGKWEDAANWSQGAPAGELRCIISNNISKTVTLDGNSASTHPETLIVNALDISAPSGATNTLSLVDSGIGTPLQVIYTLTIGSGGKLAISNGATAIGSFAGQSLTVDGELSMQAGALTATNGLTLIGASGSGQMNASNTTLLSGDTLLGSAAGTSGSLTLTGNNSIWNAGSVYVGQTGSGNHLNITGGKASDLSAYIGFNPGSSGNAALVTGSGTAWTNRNSLFIGSSGASNLLMIANGGFVTSSNGVIGSLLTAPGNAVVVSDAGTLWSNRNGLVIGASGSASSLTISNGGSVISGITKPGSNYVGNASGSNSVFVSGAGSVWRATVPVVIGNSGAGNSLVMSNGGTVFDSSGFIGANAGNSNNIALVVGSGSLWTNTGGVFVGYSGSGNRLEIRNGASVFAGRDQTTSTIGNNANSSNNSALVTGAGSLWNPGSIAVGLAGAGNSLVVDSNGLFNAFTVWIGMNSSSSNNSVRVSGGAVLQSSAGIYVGYGGSSNSLLITGGTVIGGSTGLASGSTPALTIGYASSNCDNLVEMDSGNLILTNHSGNAVLEVRRGKFILNGGTLRVDKIVMTNACGLFVRNGGTLIVSNLVLNPNLDADGDGIPNGWEQAYGLDPLNAADANVDADGDGMSNLQEYLAGTNPTNALSSLRVTSLVVTGADAQLTWTTVGGKGYTVQTSSVPGSGFSNATPPIVIPGTGESSTNYLDPGAATNWPMRFYRIRLAP